MEDDPVRAYYDSFGEREWLRLENPGDGALEFAVTCHMLEKYLTNNIRILDIGGGPGRYAIWLAQHGNQVVLADLSPELLSIARKKIENTEVGAFIEEIVEADACDLSHWPDESFDAVLSLGPFYHLPDPDERNRAVIELKRVLRPGGKTFIALMPRFSFLRRTLLVPDERHHLNDPTFIKSVLEEGIFINDIPGRFTQGYGVIPEEVSPFFEQYGFKMLALLATEGIVADNQKALIDPASNDPAIFQSMFDMVLRTAGEPSILGMASHLLYIGEKRYN